MLASYVKRIEAPDFVSRTSISTVSLLSLNYRFSPMLSVLGEVKKEADGSIVEPKLACME